jgi:hypothetical protein
MDSPVTHVNNLLHDLRAGHLRRMATHVNDAMRAT